MSGSTPASPVSIDDVIGLIRPAVRAERAYHVGAAPGVRVKLNQNESPYDLPDDLKRELVESFLSIPFNRYPTEQPHELQAEIAVREGLSADAVLVGNGSNELSYTLGLALIGDRTPVVLPRPMFALYRSLVRIYGGRLVEVGCRPDLSFDVDAIVDAIRVHEPVLTVLATPNNPTGLALPVDEVERVVRAGTGIVLVDEAYVEFNPYGSVLPLLDRYPNLLVMRTLSKAMGLAGLRLGYLLGRPELVAELLKARIPFMVDRLAQSAAHALFSRPDLVADRISAIRRGTRDLGDALREIPGVEVLPSMANFVLFRAPEAEPELPDRLVRAGMLVRDMGGYPELTGYLRVSSGTPGENRDFVAALKAVLDAEGR